MRSGIRAKDRRAAAALALVAATLILGGCQTGGGKEESRAEMHKVGALEIGVVTIPDPPRPGDNTFRIVVRDAGGRPVRDAAVETMLSMEAMGAMPRMESRGSVKEVRPGVYECRHGISMGGEWDVTIRVRTTEAGTSQATYRLSTSARGLRFESGTPPLGGAPRASPGQDGMAGMPGMAPGSAGPASGPPEGPASGAPEGTVTLDPARRQSLGIRTAAVEERELSAKIRSAGRVTPDETRRAEIALKFSGTVRELRVAITGQPVRRGDVLFTVYSPELWSAQQEYLEALRAARAQSSAATSGGLAPQMADAARRRLLLWDLTPDQILEIERAGGPRDDFPMVAPVSGVVTEKSVVQGSPFTAGQVLYRIAQLDTVWVIASVYQMDLPLVRVGDPARLLNPYLDERSRRGRVAFVSPTLDSDTRTGQVRIQVPNPHGDLKPGMFLDVELESPLGRRVAVPESAVLPTGERNLVFVDLGDGRLAPREVKLGHRAGEYYEVLGGLAAGDVVVTSGNFLVAAESKLRSATQKW